MHLSNEIAAKVDVRVDTDARNAFLRTVAEDGCPYSFLLVLTDPPFTDHTGGRGYVSPWETF